MTRRPFISELTYAGGFKTQLKDGMPPGRNEAAQLVPSSVTGGKALSPAWRRLKILDMRMNPYWKGQVIIMQRNRF